ncbi:MAG: phosphate signaling complex protein PhoU [Anaerolineae bacterium]|nr:phosphate signaling complex protein PhoU [Anaerolineae bacterium]MCO5186897.1 phosphate signaling complex protein PhoU [Anaerolineae bacterium]
MTLPQRSLLDKEVSNVRNNILAMTSMVEEAIENAMQALNDRDIELALQVEAADADVNALRYAVEEAGLRILATQFPAASDLRRVIASIHIAIELERIGDHAAGIARLATRLERETISPPEESFYDLPKMARRARKMVRQCIDAYIVENADAAENMVRRDAKLDKNYQKSVRKMLAGMEEDVSVKRGTYLLWIAHNLERIGDRTVNIAERVIFMTTGVFTAISPDDFSADD